MLTLIPRRLCRHHSLARNFSSLPLVYSQCRVPSTFRFRFRFLHDAHNIRPARRLLGPTSLLHSSSRSFSTLPNKEEKKKIDALKGLIRENIYTIPNALTVSRILSCPFLAWSIVADNFALATGILAYAAVSDWVDGFLARRYEMRTVLGTILDPAADKALMTTLTITLAVKNLVPVPLACIILGRDVLLSLAAFYIRYRTLPAPKTFQRYWDFSIPSAEVHPTRISKVNTALQLFLMGLTTISPLLSFDLGLILSYLQWMVAGTTTWSGLSYVFSSSAVRVVTSKSFRTKP